MIDYPEIKYIKVNMGCLEFIDEGFRIFQGLGDVDSVYANGKWTGPGNFPNARW